MAAERRLKQIYFNLEDQADRRLFDWAFENIKNFSDWGKRHLEADIAAAQKPAPAAGIDPAELAELVQALVKTELAGHKIVTGQEDRGMETEPDLSGFF